MENNVCVASSPGFRKQGLIHPIIGATAASLALCGCASQHAVRRDSHPRYDTVAGVASADVQSFLERLALRSTAKRALDAKGASTVRLREVQLATVVVNAGAPLAFSLFRITTRYTVVTPDSGALIEEALRSARFASRLDRAHWLASGKPTLVTSDMRPQREVIPAEQFSFTPEGRTLTYREVRSMPSQPAALEDDVSAHLHRGDTMSPPTSMLKQYGFLLAAAPVTRAVRRGLFMAIGTLTTLHPCGTGRDLLGRRGRGVCARSGELETEVLFDERSGTVLAVEQRLVGPSSLYPDLPVGTLVESDTFVASRRP